VSRLLPTASVEDVMSWGPCERWPEPLVRTMFLERYRAGL
jgi:hypothetical protein